MKRRLLSLLLVFVMVLGMLPSAAFAADIPSGAPFTAITTDAGEVGQIEDRGTIVYTGYSSYEDVPYYHVQIPVGATEVYVTHPAEEDPFCDSGYGSAYGYYAETEGWTGNGLSFAFEEAADGFKIVLPLRYSASDWMTGESVEMSFVADEDGYAEYAVAVENNTDYAPICFFTFEYYTPDNDSGEDAPAAPFLNIKVGGQEVAAENILLKCAEFLLGDYAADEQQGAEDYYDYVHTVPYYHVTVPCGTATVDVTYSADTNILNDGSNAYGYKTDLEVDAVSSATVKGVTFKNAYTENEDGTQTVKTPITGYTFDEDGNGHAITLEQDGGNFDAICLFTFGYDGLNHVYGEGVVTVQPGCETVGEMTFACTCGASYTEEIPATGHSYADGVCANCGAADPDYAAPGGAVIPDGAPFLEVTTDAGEALEIQDKGTVYYSDTDVPYYHILIPASATEVYVTHPFEEDPFADAGYGSAYGYYANTDDWTGGYMTYSFEDAEAGYKIILPLSYSAYDWMTGESMELSFVADEDGYVGYALAVERSSDFSAICFFTFEFAEEAPGEHVHDYGEGVVTTQPGCETRGEKTFTCSCGDSYTEEVPATGHKWDEGVQTKAPTCTEAGEKTCTCQNDSSHTRTETVAKLGHSYDEGVVDPKPTCTEPGVKIYTCTRCDEGTEGHTKTESLPATGHNYQNGKCENCGDICPQQDENGVFLIGTYEELLWFANQVNGGNTTISGVLSADITVAEDWPGIGNSTNKYAGTFDGQNHTVTLSGSTWGLFGYVMGTHNNHSLKDAVVIENVITAGTVKNTALTHYAGYARITNCINKAEITGGNSYVGGIVGSVIGSSKYGQTYSDVRIINCANEGDILGTNRIGGILGYCMTNTHLEGCSNTGAISGSSEVGGLAGYMQGAAGSCTIKNCYNRGTVTGGDFTGGLIGQQYNNVSIANSYNAGAAAYAIAGRIYNKTATATNVYYRADLSAYGEPEYYIGSSGGSQGFNTTERGEAKSSADMGTADFAAMLGDAFQESCGGPVLVWQEAKAHDLIDGICYECKAYHDHDSVKAKFRVIKGTGGYEIVGDTEVTDGNDYTFTVKILDGYYEENMQVYVNGTAVTADAAGNYTVTPTGHFYITVTGVKELEGVVPISLPGAGSGYRVVPCTGYGTTVESGKEFKFTVTFVEGFKAGKDFTVKANGEKLSPDADGVYTIENVILKQTITVEGVDILPVDPVTVRITITKGEKEFQEMKKTGTIMMEQKMEVPYFDLELYGLDHVYYNPYCYVDEQGNIRTQQKAGNKETAYGVVTTLHALIYATEMYYLGYDEDMIGTGYSHTQDQDGDGESDFREALKVTASAGSTFTYMWGDGGNLNYHLNYVYPIAYPGWGSTSDQQALKDGDLISIHFIAGSASGSAFGFFAVNDENNTYDKNEQLDYATVTQGETIKLTHYVASQGENYNSAFAAVGNKDLYWVEQGNESYNVEAEDEDGTTGNWYREGLGGLTAEAFMTDDNGEIIIDTTNIEPGTYYIAAHGGFTEGNGKPGADGFVSRGAEAGPAYFVLSVLEAEEPDMICGDLNSDGEINVLDANLAVSYCYGNVDFTEEQIAAADVNGDGQVDVLDANLMVSCFCGNIDKFPVEG